jgi:NAD(P)-dependent dehydrogenase (short-subunit alcohol dehydrogenase family)
VAADLATAAGVDGAVAFALESFGRAPDILINNLGVGDAGVFEELSDERWEKSFQVNLMGTVRISRALLPKMADVPGAAVVFTGSDLAKQPEPTFMDYGSCKAGLLYITKALAKKYAPRVRINAVLPGPIWSRMWTRPGGIVDQLKQHYKTDDQDAAVKRFLEDRQMPMGIGEPEDVAQAIVFLASPLAKFITGAGIDIGGTIRGLI